MSGFTHTHTHTHTNTHTCTHTYTHTYTHIHEILTHSMGKTTLLNHIAERKLAIPPTIDVLLCEQEVQADDTPAIDAVLKADTKRLKLLEEEQKLIDESEAGDDSNVERLKQVSKQDVRFHFLV